MLIRQYIVVSALMAIVFVIPGFAQDSGLGLGVFFGEETGVSLKQWSLGDTAIVGGAAWSFGGDDALILHLDYLFHNFSLLQVSEGKLPIYYGVGGRIKFEDREGRVDDDNEVGVRLPVGLNYLFAKIPIDLFLEIAPRFDLAPSTDFDMSGAIGVRYFF